MAPKRNDLKLGSKNVIQEEVDAEVKYICPNGHQLKTFGLPYIGCPCSYCKRPGSIVKCLHTCSECKVDMCTDCVLFHNELRIHPDVVRCPSCQHTVEWSNSNHEIDGWVCVKNCGGRKTNRGAWRWLCSHCGHSTCQNCAGKRGHASTAMDSSPRSIKMGNDFLDAAAKHDWEKVKAFVETRPELVNCQVGGRWSALQQAARAGHTATVTFLLDRGADATAMSSDGASALSVAKGEKLKSLMLEKCFLAPAATVFNHYDSNESGGIDAAELGWVMKSVAPDLTDSELAELFEDCDVDHNGEIDYTEFVQWLFEGRGRSLRTEILAAAESILASYAAMAEKTGEDTKEKFTVPDRYSLFKRDLESTEYAFFYNQANMPPGAEDMRPCREHVRWLGAQQMFEHVKYLDDVLEEVDDIARIRFESQAGAIIKDYEMVYAIVLHSFHLSLIKPKDEFAEEDNFRYQFNELIRLRDAELFSTGHCLCYYLMTGLSRLPASGGTVYQGIPKHCIEEALDTLREGAIIHWSTFTSAERLFSHMHEYKDALVLKIQLLTRGSKSRDISQLSAVPDMHEVLLLPNIRLRVGGQVEKRGISIIELTELVEDYAKTYVMED
eukprot:TRINITY_DN38102_c0_g1_i1.p1 TRINITY_DN38102_c0_g1~~TRINITY_DN38102_c0_g1_i1.p1  ORF type:complete len:622 (-),score=112.39 TRINITY_DN38102_c0_g1_i1:5-1837(-)